MTRAVPLSLLFSFTLPCMAFQKTGETAVRAYWDRVGGGGGYHHGVPRAGDMFGRSFIQPATPSRSAVPPEWGKCQWPW